MKLSSQLKAIRLPEQPQYTVTQTPSILYVDCPYPAMFPSSSFHIQPTSLVKLTGSFKCYCGIDTCAADIPGYGSEKTKLFQIRTSLRCEHLCGLASIGYDFEDMTCADAQDSHIAVQVQLNRSTGFVNFL